MLSVGNYLASSNAIPSASQVRKPRYGANLNALGSDVFVRNNRISFTGSCDFAVSFFEESARNGNLREYNSIPGARVFCKKGKEYGRILLLDTPVKFEEAIEKLGDIIQKYKWQYNNELKNDNFEFYKQAVRKFPDLQDLQIKGIVGQGAYCTTFLTTEGTVIKFSTSPLFPKKKEMIKGVDSKILERYTKIIDEYCTVYGAKEPFLRDASIMDIPQQQFEEIYDRFKKIIKECNKRYSFPMDFRKDERETLAQIGFDENDVPYLVDHQCVVGRWLVGEY